MIQSRKELTCASPLVLLTKMTTKPLNKSALPPKDPEMNFKGLVFGYPRKIIARKHVKENTEKLPYINKQGGDMQVAFHNLEETASLMYNLKHVYATEGQSGAPILKQETDGSYTLKGLHGGHFENKGYG